MKFNQWTLGLAAAGVVSLASVSQAEEATHQVLTPLSSTTLSGYVSTSVIWNFADDNNGPNRVPGRAFDNRDKQDRVNLDVIKLKLEKPLDEGDWSAGYNVELLFGPDAVGYNPSVNAGDPNSDFAIKQAYVALRVPVGNGIDFKIGTWDTIIGYEVFDAGSNPNYSRSYGYTIEPTAMTGVLASYRWSDWISSTVGIANHYNDGVNERPDHESLKTYMGSVTFTAPENTGFLAGAVLTLGIIDGGEESATRGGAYGDDIINYYAGVTVPLPITGLSVGASFDWRENAVSDGSEEMAIAGYVSWQATEKLRLNARVEWADYDDDIPGATPRAGGAGAGFAGSGIEQALGLTFTVDYNLWENVMTRLELRYDDADFIGGAVPAGAGFGDGTDDNALTLALNIIYKF